MVSQEAGRHAQLHILGITGSMRQGSYSTQVLKMVLEEAKKYKTDTQILELRQVNLSIYDASASNESNNNNDIERVSNALKWADSIILIDSFSQKDTLFRKAGSRCTL